jgi:hypothetical protein
LEDVLEGFESRRVETARLIEEASVAIDAAGQLQEQWRAAIQKAAELQAQAQAASEQRWEEARRTAAACLNWLDTIHSN